MTGSNAIAASAGAGALVLAAVAALAGSTGQAAVFAVLGVLLVLGALVSSRRDKTRDGF